MTAEPAAVEFVIRPRPRLSGVRDLWQHRELFYFFAWRDIKAKYKQTWLGVAWVVLQPTMMMVVLNFAMGSILRVPSEGIPYPLFLFPGLMLWGFFASGATAAANSLVVHSQMLTKVYFPRLIVPISAVFVSLFDLLMAGVVYVGLLVGFGVRVDFVDHFLQLCGAVGLLFIMAIAVGVLFASLNLLFRDARHVFPFLIQVLFFLSPVIYPPSTLAARSRLLSELNPIAAALGLARASLVHQPASWSAIGAGVCVGLALLALALYVFARTEAYFADKV